MKEWGGGIHPVHLNLSHGSLTESGEVPALAAARAPGKTAKWNLFYFIFSRLSANLDWLLLLSREASQ